jgi:membrane protein DedA with SNARE-associated domain
MLVIGVVAACASTMAGVIMFLLGGVSLIIIPTWSHGSIVARASPSFFIKRVSYLESASEWFQEKGWRIFFVDVSS